MKFLLLVFISALALANIPMVVEAPETEVEVSIYDLVKKSKISLKPKLAKDFSEKVADALEAKRTDLSSCISKQEEALINFQVELFISRSGKANVTFRSKFEDKNIILECLKTIFTEMTFPTHDFTK